MKIIETKDAVGHILCHDITRIIPGKEKGPVFRKGHIVTKEDIPVLLTVGKEHLYVWDDNGDVVHENEAAAVLASICTGGSDSITLSEAKEGKIELFSAVDGLLKIDSDRLKKINSHDELMIATIKGNLPIRKGDKIAGTRIIPLAISCKVMEDIKQQFGDKPLITILPYAKINYSLIVTGSEVYKGLIEDKFGPVIKAKMDEYGATLISKHILPDDREMISSKIKEVSSDSDLILITGGMSVDPDDKTPGAIKATGANIIRYGAPVLPGAMFLLSYLSIKENSMEKTIPVLGLPGCIMYAGRTIFDLVLPRIIAGELLSSEDLAVLGEGGLCLNCSECRFPNCGFGK